MYIFVHKPHCNYSIFFKFELTLIELNLTLDKNIFVLFFCKMNLESMRFLAFEHFVYFSFPKSIEIANKNIIILNKPCQIEFYYSLSSYRMKIKFIIMNQNLREVRIQDLHLDQLFNQFFNLLCLI